MAEKTYPPEVLRMFQEIVTQYYDWLGKRLSSAVDESISDQPADVQAAVAYGDQPL